MKQTDIKLCLLCRKGVMHTGLPLFYHVTIARMGVDVQAVKRQYGLELMLGSHVLAHHMGTNSDIARPITGPFTALICEECAMSQIALAELAERMMPADKGERDDQPL